MKAKQNTARRWSMIAVLGVLWIGVLCSLLASATVTATRAASDAPSTPSAVSFTGTWVTIAGGSTRYTVTLKQTGNKVTGTYTPGNGKIFDVQDFVRFLERRPGNGAVAQAR